MSRELKHLIARLDTLIGLLEQSQGCSSANIGGRAGGGSRRGGVVADWIGDWLLDNLVRERGGCVEKRELVEAICADARAEGLLLTPRVVTSWLDELVPAVWGCFKRNDVPARSGCVRGFHGLSFREGA